MKNSGLKQSGFIMKFKILLMVIFCQFIASISFAANDDRPEPSEKNCEPRKIGEGGNAKPPKGCPKKCYTSTGYIASSISIPSKLFDPPVGGIRPGVARGPAYFNMPYGVCVGTHASEQLVLKAKALTKYYGMAHGFDLYDVDDEGYLAFGLTSVALENTWAPSSSHGGSITKWPFRYFRQVHIWNQNPDSYYNWEKSVLLGFHQNEYYFQIKKPVVGRTVIRNARMFEITFGPFYDEATLTPSWELVINGDVTVTQTCMVDGGHTMDFSQISGTDLRAAQGQVTDRIKKKEGLITVKCSSVTAGRTAKIQMTTPLGVKNDAIVANVENKVGFKVEDEDQKPFFTNDLKRDIGELEANVEKKIKFNAWPVFLGSTSDPIPTGGDYTARATLEVDFD